MGRDRAAYMREYRARKRRSGMETWMPSMLNDYARIRELEEEVRHLKAELAKRPAPSTVGVTGHSFNSRPFTPVPRK